MFCPTPKPTPKEKKLKTRLKVRTRMKQGKSNPFPDLVKKRVFERQGGKCAYSGMQVDNFRDLEYHHIKFKGSGSSKWEHDERNCVGLFPMYHVPMIHSGNEATYWRMVWEVWAVCNFKWLGGEEITKLSEWVEINEYRLKKSKINYADLFSEWIKRSVTG